MKQSTRLKQQEGRKLEFKEVIPSKSNLAKTVVAFAKIECAIFKGTVPGNFIDQKTIEGSIATPAEAAFNFVLRHISQGTTGYNGVYRQDRWEYPIEALREVIRNAIIHRDYSLSGKDIKIAIFDDKVEITSPGKLMPSVDFELMEAGQSEIRNKVLAPVFKKLGIIEQWGNGLKIISDDLKNYPEIELNWSEPGIAFRVTFSKKSYTPESAEKMSEKMSEKTREKILSVLKATPYIAMNELAEIVGISKKVLNGRWQNSKKKAELNASVPTKADIGM